MNYAKISKDTFDLLYKARESLNNSPLSPTMRVLAELRVSQINGCAYCCRLHSEEALKLGVPQINSTSCPPGAPRPPSPRRKVPLSNG